MMSYESLHTFKLIKISIPNNFLTLWKFFLQFLTLFKDETTPVASSDISMHAEKQCSSHLRGLDPRGLDQ